MGDMLYILMFAAGFLAGVVRVYDVFAEAARPHRYIMRRKLRRLAHAP